MMEPRTTPRRLALDIDGGTVDETGGNVGEAGGNVGETGETEGILVEDV